MITPRTQSNRALPANRRLSGRLVAEQVAGPLLARRGFPTDLVALAALIAEAHPQIAAAGADVGGAPAACSTP